MNGDRRVDKKELKEGDGGRWRWRKGKDKCRRKGREEKRWSDGEVTRKRGKGRDEEERTERDRRR